MSKEDLTYICDNKRHLICLPYSIENLHRMADELNLERHWFHKGKRNKPHYDIPIKRIEEITSKCHDIVSDREIVKIIKENV